MTDYKLFIPSAGIGSRLGNLTDNTNKALVKVNGKEVISYIVDKFPEDIEIVIALGYKGEQVRYFLQSKYPNRNFTFIEIDNFDGPGSSLGYTMFQCKEHLQCPFVFISNDTIILEKIPEPNENYMGYSSERDVSKFRSVRLNQEGNVITELCEKGAQGNIKPYIGLSGVKDWKEFWKVLEKNKESFMKIGESAGLRLMIETGIPMKGIEFSWFDTGNLDDLIKTEKVLKELNNKKEIKENNKIQEKKSIEKYIKKRTKCPLCLSTNISEGIEPHINLKFPVLPVCVNQPLEKDDVAPFTICICEKCGLIMLQDVVEPEILYKIFHSDGIGKVWESHYSNFADLIKKHLPKGKLLEIGAGQGKLIIKLLERYDSGIEVVDPLYQGPKENVKVHESILNQDTVSNFSNDFDAVISSHTLEHFLEFNDYFKSAWKVLKDKGLLFTSIPNQESNFAKGYGNQLNFEHPSICTNAHWIYLHYLNGFKIKEIYFFNDHSVQFVAEKTTEPQDFTVDVKELSRKLLDQYWSNIKDRMQKIKQFAKPNKENWIFGASNFTQPLFVYGLSEDYFKGVLDNSPLKHNKRLYGTNLICRKPEEIVTNENNDLRVFLNIGQYNSEVYQQLIKINSNIEIIFL